VSWESFPDQAQNVIDQFGGKVIERIDTLVKRLWIVMIKGSEFWLSFEDFPLGLPLGLQQQLQFGYSGASQGSGGRRLIERVAVTRFLM
jgi:hypothetical protein